MLQTMRLLYLLIRHPLSYVCYNCGRIYSDEERGDGYIFFWRCYKCQLFDIYKLIE